MKVLLTRFCKDSDTNPNTTASSVAGDAGPTDGRRRRAEAQQLRKSMFGKKHDRLGESKVREMDVDDACKLDATRADGRVTV